MELDIRPQLGPPPCQTNQPRDYNYPRNSGRSPVYASRVHEREKKEPDDDLEPVYERLITTVPILKSPYRRENGYAKSSPNE